MSRTCPIIRHERPNLFGNLGLYSHTKDNRYRFYLGESGEKTLLAVGVNPSTASLGQSDHTIRKLKRFAALNDYQGWAIINLYSQRATNPNHLHQRRQTRFTQANLAEIQHLQSLLSAYDFLLCWGNLIEKRRFLQECLREIEPMIRGRNIYILGEPTLKGHPPHPLMLSYETPFRSFSLEQYMTQIKG